MHISDFDYLLPPELIALEPASPRDSSRMLVLQRDSGELIDSMFRNIPEFLRAGDLLVINDTRVMKARLHGVLERASGTSRTIEVLFAGPLTGTLWEVMCKPGKRVRKGDRVVFDGGSSIGTFGDLTDHGLRKLEMPGKETVPELLERAGHIPLPPYIERQDDIRDRTSYQTMFAEHPGAVAAPTAGLHFTPAIRDVLRRRGIEVAKITLHVGVGTFQPVRDEDPSLHKLKPEWFNLTTDAALQLNLARQQGRRIVAVGTTTTRTLEYVFSKYDTFEASSGYADAFILPGYRFQAIQGLLTNFHLPCSTLLMLVSAFASVPAIRSAYAHAIDEHYRFYSYGDCMLIL